VDGNLHPSTFSPWDGGIILTSAMFGPSSKVRELVSDDLPNSDDLTTFLEDKLPKLAPVARGDREQEEW